MFRSIGIVMFQYISHHIFPCAIGLKSTLGPPNMADQDYIAWDCINITLNNTLKALDHQLLNLEGAENIPQELSKFIRQNTTKRNTYCNETQIMTKVEETSDLEQHFNNLTICLDDAKK